MKRWHLDPNICKWTPMLNAANGGCSGTLKRLHHAVGIHSTDVDLTKLNYDLNNQNRFAVLAGLKIRHIPPWNRPPKQKSSPNPRTNALLDTRKLYHPPISLYNVNVENIVKQLQAKTLNVRFKVKKMTGNKSKPNFTDLATHSAMLQTLREFLLY